MREASAMKPGSDPRLHEAYAAGAAAFPDVPLAEPDFAAHVGPRLAGREPLTAEQAADLYLACACARGEKRALAHLERIFLPAAAKAVARFGLDASEVDEVLQRVRAKLLVAEDGQSKIHDFDGRGPLAAWLRAVALRETLTLKRRQKASKVASDDDLLQEVAGGSGDPELDFVKQKYAPDFKAAFQGALASLEPRERNVLRLNLLDGLSIDEIGAIYRVHRATAARWITRIRETLLERTRAGLAQRVKLRGPELDSLMGLLRSQLDVSVRRYLGESKS